MEAIYDGFYQILSQLSIMFLLAEQPD